MNPLKRFFLNDKVIFALILINAIVIFAQGFIDDPNDTRLKDSGWDGILSYADNAISLLFLLEMITKIAHFGFRDYWKAGWNRIDFLLVLLSIPAMVMLVVPLDNFIDLGFLLVFRVFRVFKFFRFIQFFPQVDHIFRSVQQAMKSSIMVLIGFFVVIFIMSILCCFFYQNVHPEMFGNPLKAYYSTFQVFTIEGWNGIPNELVATGKMGDMGSFFTKTFFSGLFILGGVFGLSIVNSLFVDAMVNDEKIAENTEKIEEQTEKIGEKTEEIEEKTEELEVKTDRIEQYILQLQQQIQSLAQEIQSLKQK